MNSLTLIAIEPGELGRLISRAADSLASATTAAEVLDARDEAAFAYDQAKAAARLAKAKGAHDEITAKVHRSQADALEILAGAKRRLADEYDAAQERGEVAGHGGKRGNQHAAKVDDDNVATVADIGLSRPEIFEARQIKAAIEADPTIVRRVLDEILEAGEEPTKARLRKELAPVIAKERKVVQAGKKERRQAREIALAAKIEALPTRRFGVVLADPEWRFEPFSRETGMDRAPDNHYPTSETSDIAARDVASIAADDCVLFLWATVPMLPDAMSVMKAWGFDYKSHMIWSKERAGEQRGTGYWFSVEHELLLVGTRGNVPAPAMGTQWRSVIEARVEGHSEKPEIFLEMIEDYFPNLPKIELNRRGPARPGWDAWGLEASPPEAEPKPEKIADSDLSGQGLRATPPEGAAAVAHGLYDEAIKWIDGQRLAGKNPGIAALREKFDIDYDAGCVLFDAIVDRKKPPKSGRAKALPEASERPAEPSENLATYIVVPGLGKNNYAKFSVFHVDGTFKVGASHWIGFTGGSGPAAGNFDSYDDALRDGFRQLREAFDYVVGSTLGTCEASHKAVARRGLKWLDKQADAWGLTIPVPAPADIDAEPAAPTPLELYIAEHAEGGAA